MMEYLRFFFGLVLVYLMVGWLSGCSHVSQYNKGCQAGLYSVVPFTPGLEKNLIPQWCDGLEKYK